MSAPPIRRHCMVVHAYYPLGETRVEREALALRDRGVEVDVVCLQKRSEPREEVIDGVTVHRVPLSRGKGKGLLMQLIEYLRFFILAMGRVTLLHLRRRYAVVQVHNLPDFLIFSALVPRLMGAGVILDLHDLMPEFYAERFDRRGYSAALGLIKLQERVSCMFADRIITVTDLWREALVARGQPREKITVVMNVADDRFFNPLVVPDGRFSRQDGFRLLYHGNIDHRYGLDLAVEAIDLARRQAPDIHLTIHGGGQYREALEAMIDRANLRDHVAIRRVLPTEALAKRIKSMDLGIVPYRNGIFSGDLLPTKLMEYAALGVPAIVARTRTIATYFDESMVEFFEPGNAEDLAGCILRLYRDRTRLEELARNISTVTRRFPWSQQRTEYLKMVQGLWDTPRRHQQSGIVPTGGLR